MLVSKAWYRSVLRLESGLLPKAQQLSLKLLFEYYTQLSLDISADLPGDRRDSGPTD